MQQTLGLTLPPKWPLMSFALDVIRSVAQFKICVHTLCYETVAWLKETRRSQVFPNFVTVVRQLILSRMSNMPTYTVYTQVASLRRKFAHLFAQTSLDVSTAILNALQDIVFKQVAQKDCAYRYCSQRFLQKVLDCGGHRRSAWVG